LVTKVPQKILEKGRFINDHISNGIHVLCTELEDRTKLAEDDVLLWLVGTIAYFLLQKEKPCLCARRSGAYNYFDRLDPILRKRALRTDSQGIVGR